MKSTEQYLETAKLEKIAATIKRKVGIEDPEEIDQAVDWNPEYTKGLGPEEIKKVKSILKGYFESMIEDKEKSKRFVNAQQKFVDGDWDKERFLKFAKKLGPEYLQSAKQTIGKKQ